jgi:S-DNA-T family DNA segregation ATPase FtsK/SpoIIIE
MVDGWATIKSDFDYLEPVLRSLAIQGLSYGIHVAISVTRWIEIRPADKDMLGTRIELGWVTPSTAKWAASSPNWSRPVGRAGVSPLSGCTC